MNLFFEESGDFKVGTVLSQAGEAYQVEMASGKRTKVKIKDELTDYTPKVRIEIVAPDEVAETIFQRITEVAQTGHYGDGLVWITDIERAAFVFKTTPDPE